MTEQNSKLQKIYNYLTCETYHYLMVKSSIRYELSQYRSHLIQNEQVNLRGCDLGETSGQAPIWQVMLWESGHLPSPMVYLPFYTYLQSIVPKLSSKTHLHMYIYQASPSFVGHCSPPPPLPKAVSCVNIYFSVENYTFQVTQTDSYVIFLPMSSQLLHSCS